MCFNQSFKKFAFLFFLMTLSSFLGACDAATELEEDPTGATPSLAVTQSIAPLNQLVTTDTLAILDAISNNTLFALQEVYDFEDLSQQEYNNLLAFRATINPNQVDDVFQLSDETGTMQVGALAEELTADGSLSTEWPADDCTAEGVCSCSVSGTKQVAGELAITLSPSSLSGVIEGDYSILYTNCIEFISLSTADSTCTQVVKVNGTLEQSVTINFSDFQEQQTSDYFFEESAFRDIEQTTITEVPLTFANALSPTATFSADDTADFNFTYDFTDGTPLIEADGSILHLGVEYNSTVVQEFLESSESTDVCVL